MYDKFYYSGNVNQAIEYAGTNTKTEFTWVLHKDVCYDDFDLRFVPDRFEQQQAHAWASHNNPQAFTTWLLPNEYNDINFKSYILPSKQQPKTLYWPNFVECKLTGNDWYDCLCNWLLEQQDVGDDWVWVCDSRIDYTDFNFNWLPNFFDNNYIHCFVMNNKTQLSYTWLVNRQVLKNRLYKFYSSNLEFMNPGIYSDLVVLDMGCHMKEFTLHNNKMRFIGNMEDTLRTAIKRTQREWLWVISSCCIYDNFAFNYLPDLDRLQFTHCWPSGTQRKGDTFLIHIPTFLTTNQFTYDFEHDAVERRHWPVVIYNEDSLAEAVKNNKNTSLYTMYTKSVDNLWRYPEPCLWNNRPVVSLNICNSTNLVPRECLVKDEIYEYAYLEKLKNFAESIDISIIFIENGETCASDNWIKLGMNLPTNVQYPTRVVGQKTRLAAYKAAAQASLNDWFIAVFAKCEITEKFRMLKWRPDYWQKPKHYIFYNHNRDLDLTYGHMAPIAYNKKLMLSNKGGLDMTLSQAHTVVPVVISETHLTDAWETWRTAFRETAKLMYYAKFDNSIELQYRLNKWLKGTDKNIWFKKGAEDAVDYFESVDGDLGWLMLTNEWDFIKQIYDRNHNADLTV